MGNYVSIKLSNIKPTEIKEGQIKLFKHPNFKGENILLEFRKDTYNSTDLEKMNIDNNIISSMIIGPNTIVILYDSDDKQGKKVKLINKTVDKDYYYSDFTKLINQFSDWTWNDIVSSIDIKKYNNILYDNIKKNVKDYTVNILINGQNMKFDYGKYHNIWLNTNENNMLINTFPSENVRIEFWTGYHIGQGRRTLIDRKNNIEIVNKGIFRSMDVQKVKHLKDVNNSGKYTQINESGISKDYQDHGNIRPEEIKKRDVEYTDYNFNEKSKLIEIFTNNFCNFNNEIILFIILLFFVRNFNIK